MRYREIISESVSGVFYHGTNQTFDRFEKRQGTVASIFGSEKVDRYGFFFTKNPEFAKLFGKNLLKVHLTIRKPFDMRHGISVQMENELSEHGISFKWLLQGDDWEKFDGEDGEHFVSTLISLGYDGAIINEPDDDGIMQTSIIAFGPDQIRIL